MDYALAPPLPSALQLEVTSACNLRCAMCLVRYRPPVNKLEGAMPLSTFRVVVDAVPGLRQLTLQGLGEPLLSPHLLDMIDYAKRHGVRVGFNSNATLLTQAMARRLVASGLDWLHVSLDGATATTFEQIRQGANFQRVVDNLSGLVAAKREAGSAAPWIRVVFVAMRANIEELPRLVELLGRVGVSELRVQNLSHSFSDTDPAGAYHEIRQFATEQALASGPDQRDAERAFDAATEAARTSGLVLRLPALQPVAQRTAPPGCTWPWDSAYVTSRGVVQPCCMVMGDDRLALGDLTTQSFDEIWGGEPYREFRRRLLIGDPPEVCAGCALYQGTF